MNTLDEIAGCYEALDGIRVSYRIANDRVNLPGTGWITIRKPKRDSTGDYYHLAFKRVPKTIALREFVRLDRLERESLIKSGIRIASDQMLFGEDLLD